MVLWLKEKFADSAAIKPFNHLAIVLSNPKSKMWIDITLLIIALLALWKGWQKGFIISIFTSLAWILGIIGALKLSTVAAILLRDKFGWHSTYVPIVSFIL